ncbi:PMS1 protein homolog 1-like [Copidosoma floridanum]|uniref:PMS1 protein homolog 1-like n=1 Tax=Copidosoma floridanum TaxID=29053 RepID=UPI000C6FAF3C|nr:PMS1 protein homolog 1-like [Copidosoma floridanum]
MSIKPLDSKTIKLINSTQVITSIYSAVKELVENSLDAHAQNIEVNLVDDGLSLIEVKDNGVGISKEDAQYMGLSSYTSKIQNFNDLDLLSTYGFRGEGLTAVCQVSDVVVSTKTADDETVTSYTLDNEGYVVLSDICHGLNGTTVQMKNLFKNMPVRRNILNNKKRITQEIKAVELLLKNYAMCMPSIRFVYRVNSNVVFMKSSHKSLIESVKSVLGMQLYTRLYHIEKNFGENEMQLFIPKKTIEEHFSRIAQAGMQFVCVNGRPIKSKEVEKLINKRLSEYFFEVIVTPRKYMFCLILKVNPAMLDVNLEPNKDKIFLQNEATILRELDILLCEYYGLQESQTQSDIENVNVNGNLNELEKDNERDQEAANETPALKKRKVDDKNKSSKDNKNKNSIDGPNKIVEPDEPTLQKTDEFLKTWSQPVLSDVDTDDELKKKSKDAHTNASEATETASTQSSESESFDLGIGHLNKNQMMKIEEERFSQLPVVDLGDDFDWREIVTRCNKNLMEKDSLNESEVREVSDIMWSRGQIPGLQGGVSIGISNNESNETNNGKQTDESEESAMLDIAAGIPRIDHDEDSTTKSRMRDIFEFGCQEFQKNSKKPPIRAKSTTPSTTKRKSTVKDDPNQPRIPFAGDNACLSSMGPSAFAMYCSKVRTEIVKNHPDFTPADVAAELNKQWKNTSSEEREFYRELANQQKQNSPIPLSITPKKQKPELSELEREKNRKKLVNMLGNMKSNKADVKNESMIMRTYVPWNINLPVLTHKFKKEIPMEIPETPTVIGSLNSLLWIAKITSSLYIFDVSELNAQLSITECDMNKISKEYVSSIVNRWMTEKNDMNVFYLFHKLKNT